MIHLTCVGKEITHRSSNLILGVEHYHSPTLLVDVYNHNTLLEDNLAIYTMPIYSGPATPFLGIYPKKNIMNPLEYLMK